MKKIFLVISLLGVVGFCPAQSRSLDDAIRESVSYFAGRIPRHAHIAAVPISTGIQGLSDYITDRISYALVNNGSFTVIERNQKSLDDLNKEIVYQLAGNVSDEKSLYLGKQLEVQYIINGTFIRVGMVYELNLKMLDVEKARVVGQWSAGNILRSERIASLDIITTQVRVDFAGVNLNETEQELFIEELRQTLKEIIPNVELVGQEERSAYYFVITINSQQTSVPIVNTTFIKGYASIAFFQNGRNVQQSNRKEISETNQEWFLRRAVEKINADKNFFQVVSTIVARGN